MQPRTVTRFFAPPALVLMLTIGGCANPVPAGSGAAAPSAALATAAAAAQAAGSDGVPTGAQVGASTAAGTQAVIPSAPGTAGPTAAPPVDTAAPVTSGAGIVATPLPACTSGSLETVTTGKLTITTGAAPAAPWFVGTDPAAGRGLEPAVALAVAKELGYSASDVVWTRSDAAAVLAGRAAGFDLALGEFATPDQDSGPVDYSTGYFSISESVVARTGTSTAAAKSLAQLRSARLATVTGADGAGMAASAQIVGGNAPARYATAAAGLTALRAGTVDAVVVPTPAAVSAGTDVTVVGQLAEQGEQPPQFGMVLPRKSPLTACVSAAIDQLRVTGTLAGLVRTWVPAAAKPLR